MEERRIAYRYKVPLAVVIRSLSQVSEPFRGKTRDVSTGGLYFTSDRRLAVGMKLDISLTLPRETTHSSDVVIDAQARVVRVDEQPGDGTTEYGIAARVDRFNVSPVAVGFALHKAEQAAITESTAT